MKAWAAVLVAVAVAVTASLMHGEAYAQTDIRIGVLLSHPNDIDAGPWEAMKLAERDLNSEFTAINSTVTLERIDVSDFANPQSVVATIASAYQRGLIHFIAPSDEVALGAVKGTVDTLAAGLIPGAEGLIPVAASSILISPKSQTVVHPLYNSDDNLFRLTPNNDELSRVTIPLYDKYGTDRLIMVIDAARGSAPFPAPEAVRDRFGIPFEPLLVYSEDTPNSGELNLQAATDLNNRLGALIDEYGQNSVGVMFVSDVAHYNALVGVINDNPNLANLDSVRWYGTDAILVDEVATDPSMAEFSARVSMTILAYEIFETPIVNELKALPNPSRLHNVYANYAAYDAVHLLASSILIAGADNPNLKETILEVANDDIHVLQHTTRLLGEGALGDYSLDRQTGDLAVGAGNFNEHRMGQSGGGYIWLELDDRAPQMCR